MTSLSSWVVVVLIVEGALLAIALTLLFGHEFWTFVQQRHNGPHLQEGRRALGRLLEGQMVQEPVLEVLPPRLQITLFEELAPKLSGINREKLASLAERLGVLERAETLCRGHFWPRRLRGARILTFLGGGEEIVPALMSDQVMEVRAQAAEWAGEHPTPHVLNRLITMLDDQESLCRFAVQDSLLRLGGATVEPLAAFLAGQPRAGVEPALRVAASLGDPRFLRAALAYSEDAFPNIAAQAVDALGAIGGASAVDRLAELLGHDSARVRAAAARSLGRLEHWPAAPKLAALLADSSWDVRREAGLALRECGAPGILMLRRCVGHEDRFAADMARRVLDVLQKEKGAA